MLFALCVLMGQPQFESFFKPETMRLDFFHTGNHELEFLSLDRIWNDGPWSGNPDYCLDELNRGAYRFELALIDGTPIFSRGFSSIFGEWQTTEPAKSQYGTFQESIRFPWPKQKVKVSLQKRDESLKFNTIGSFEIDPENRQINSSLPQKQVDIRALVSNGSPAKKVDLALLSEGFEFKDKEKFFTSATRLIDAFFKVEPYQSRKSDFNVWAIFKESQETGISRPHHSIHKRSLLECQYSSFDSERYILSTANKTVRDLASAVPYDFTVILINEKTYGGGGIYNLYATCPVDSEQSNYLFIHEFGHHFAALADEYFTSDVAYEIGDEKEHPEPWEPNITSHPKKGELKWASLADPSLPLPTPWEKAKYEQLGKEVREKRNLLRSQHAQEKDLDDLFKFQADSENTLFMASPFNNKVGAFEGAGYFSDGMYRPRLDCLMFSRNPVGFCPVCAQAINQVIDMYSK